MKCPWRVYRIAPAHGHVPPNVYPCGQAARLRLLSLSFAPLDYVSRSRQFKRLIRRISMAIHNLQLYNMFRLPRDDAGDMFRLHNSGGTFHTILI